MKKLYDNIDGKEIYLYTIESGNLSVDICEIGARINAIRVGGVDIALGFNSVGEYIASGTYAGATIGRVANRIADGKFTLNGKEYQLNINNGENHLHGGNEGFDKKQFTVTTRTDNSVTMEYVSADGEENYPGNLRFTVKFTVDKNSLLMEYEAVASIIILRLPTWKVFCLTI